MGGEPHDIDLENEDDHQSEVEVLPQETRKGEKKSMYLSRGDFSRHGDTDGCVGCRVIASGKQGRTGVAHSRACRRRLEEIIREQEPERWARHVRRQGGDERHGEQAEGGNHQDTDEKT